MNKIPHRYRVIAAIVLIVGGLMAAAIGVRDLFVRPNAPPFLFAIGLVGGLTYVAGGIYLLLWVRARRRREKNSNQDTTPLDSSMAAPLSSTHDRLK